MAYSTSSTATISIIRCPSSRPAGPPPDVRPVGAAPRAVGCVRRVLAPGSPPSSRYRSARSRAIRAPLARASSSSRHDVPQGGEIGGQIEVVGRARGRSRERHGPPSLAPEQQHPGVAAAHGVPLGDRRELRAARRGVGPQLRRPRAGAQMLRRRGQALTARREGVGGRDLAPRRAAPGRASRPAARKTGPRLRNRPPGQGADRSRAGGPPGEVGGEQVGGRGILRAEGGKATAMRLA